MAYTDAAATKSIDRAGLSLAAAGTAVPASGAGNGIQWPNTGRELLRVRNGNAGACTVTLVVAKTIDGQAVASRTVVVAATTGDMVIGPFPTGVYNDGSGKAKADFSINTTVTYDILRPAGV